MDLHDLLTIKTHLQDLADEAAKQNEPVLDFPLPKLPQSTDGIQEQEPQEQQNLEIIFHEDMMKIKDIPNKGKGFHAVKDIPGGTLLVMAKPVAIIMGWEEDEFDDDDDEEGADEADDDHVMNGAHKEEIKITNHQEEDVEMIEEEKEEVDGAGLIQSNGRNGNLAIKVARAIQQKPSLWFQHVSKLFPRGDASTLPLWTCEDPSIGMEYEQIMNELQQLEPFQQQHDDNGNNNTSFVAMRNRLPFIVRYNCLSVETSPELFVHPDQQKGGHVTISGTGLYNKPSYFNHSNQPNMSRWSIGDIMFFVTNQNVMAGTELCISYIESEFLGDEALRKSLLLEMNVEDTPSTATSAISAISATSSDTKNIDSDEIMMKSKELDEEDDEASPVISLDVQDELMNMHPLDRLHEINRLLSQCDGDYDNIQDLDDEERDLVWYPCDAHRLHTLRALTFESLDQTSKAMEEWKDCISFVETKLPPADEAGIVIYVQAALCALQLSHDSMAKHYASIALTSHDLIFGGGVQFFRRRYANEMELTLRSSSKALAGKSAMDALWSIPS
jgi:hypothetical protein